MTQGGRHGLYQGSTFNATTNGLYTLRRRNLISTRVTRNSIQNSGVLYFLNKMFTFFTMTGPFFTSYGGSFYGFTGPRFLGVHLYNYGVCSTHFRRGHRVRRRFCTHSTITRVINWVHGSVFGVVLQRGPTLATIRFHLLGYVFGGFVYHTITCFTICGQYICLYGRATFYMGPFSTTTGHIFGTTFTGRLFSLLLPTLFGGRVGITRYSCFKIKVGFSRRNTFGQRGLGTIFYGRNLCFTRGLRLRVVCMGEVGGHSLVFHGGVFVCLVYIFNTKGYTGGETHGVVGFYHIGGRPMVHIKLWCCFFTTCMYNGGQCGVFLLFHRSRHDPFKQLGVVITIWGFIHHHSGTFIIFGFGGTWDSIMNGPGVILGFLQLGKN